MAAGIEAPAKEAPILFKINKPCLDTSWEFISSSAAGCITFTFSMVVLAFLIMGLGNSFIS